MEGEWRDMINDRLKDAISELRKKNEMFKTWSKRSQELRTILDDVEIDGRIRKLLEEYFETLLRLSSHTYIGRAWRMRYGYCKRLE